MEYEDIFKWSKHPAARNAEDAKSDTDVSLRIDKQQIWEVKNASYRLKNYQPSELSVINVPATIDLEVINQMIAGNELLLKWQLPNGDWNPTVKYSLDGAAEELTKLVDWCQSGHSPVDTWGKKVDEPANDDWN